MAPGCRLLKGTIRIIRNVPTFQIDLNKFSISITVVFFSSCPKNQCISKTGCLKIRKNTIFILFAPGDFLLPNMANHQFSPPFGRIFFIFVPSSCSKSKFCVGGSKSKESYCDLKLKLQKKNTSPNAVFGYISCLNLFPDAQNAWNIYLHLPLFMWPFFHLM